MANEAHPPPSTVRDIFEQPGAPQLLGAYERIVRTIYTLDEQTVFEELNAKLRFSKAANRMEYGELVDAIEEATQLANKASLLHVNARVALETYLADVEVMRADMRDRARADLEGDKRKNEGKGKAITDADLRARMAGMYPDDFRSVEVRTAKAEGAIKHLGQLHDRWVERVRVLDAILRTSRKI